MVVVEGYKCEIAWIKKTTNSRQLFWWFY